ncbi:hypothetical protein Tco_1372886 [Tanacetum coccineum]
MMDSNEDECFTPSDNVELLLHHDSSTPMISLVSILKGLTNEPPLEENGDLFDLESKKNEWKKILYDAPIDDLIFNPGDNLMRSILFLMLIFLRILKTVIMIQKEIYSILRVCLVIILPLVSLRRIARILKTLMLVVLSIVHSILNPSHAYIWESDIRYLIDLTFIY